MSLKNLFFSIMDAATVPFKGLGSAVKYGLIAVCVLGCTTRYSVANEKPNIVLIMADDLGFECLGVNGADTYQTPVLDQLAAEGVRFENCFANTVCTPSRVKLMTGKSNARNYLWFGKLDRKEKTFAHTFQEAGYVTAIAGKWQLGKQVDAPQHFGFDEACLWQHTRPRTKEGTKFDSRYSQPWLEINGVETNYAAGFYGPDVCTDFLCDFIEENKDRPFLAYYPMLLTHCPFTPTPDSADWDPDSPGSKSYGGDTRYFPDMVNYMDKLVGRIVEQLEKNKLLDNTIIIFIGDNGTDTPVVTSWKGQKIRGGKRTITDAGTRVPLIVSCPGKIQSNTVSDELIDFADFFPTMCDAAGIAVPADGPVDGVSFWDTLQGIPGRNKPWVYIWSEKKVLARTRTHMLRRKSAEDPFVFIDYSVPYHEEVLDIEAIAGAERKTYQTLLEVINEFDSIRNSSD